MTTPSDQPSDQPSPPPYYAPSYGASQPYYAPSYAPTDQPSYRPTEQPYYAPSYAPTDQPFVVAPPTTGRGGRGRLMAAAAAVVVIGGGVATYAAVSSSSVGGGAASPRAAVSGFIRDLDNADFVGMLNDLPPGERSAIGRPLLDTVGSLKRNDVLRPDANLSTVSGIDIAVRNLTYADSTVTINDHVQVVELTGGTVRVDADARKLPLTADVLRALGAGSAPLSPTTTTVDIGRQVRRTGAPIRIATQKVDGRWYPSLMYTIADNTVTQEHLKAPTADQRIPAIGATSPDAAVRSFIEALLAGDLETAGELLSPDELAVLHDYGQLIIDRTKYPATGVHIDTIDFTDTPLSGATRVSVRSVRLTVDGREISASVDGSCYSLTAGGRTQRFCADQLLSSSEGRNLTPAQRTALNHLFTGQRRMGLDVTRSAGRYYVNPVRSFLEFGNDLMSDLKAGDGKALLGMIHD